VVPVRSTARTGLLRVTFPPWMTPPVLSATVPRRDVVPVCAAAAEVKSKPGERWKLSSTIGDLEVTRSSLEDVYLAMVRESVEVAG